MKINAVSFYTNKPTKNLLCPNCQASFCCSSYPKDTVTFGSSDKLIKAESSKIDECIKNKKLREEIKQKLCKFDKTRSKELENDFVQYYRFMLNSFDEINTDEAKNMMAYAVCETLRALPSDYKTTNSKIIKPIIDAYNALVYNQTNIFEVYRMCREKDNSIDTNMANKIFLWQYAVSKEIHPYQSKLILNKYCKDKEGNISDERILNIASLFKYTACEFPDESDAFIKLVLINPNDYTSDIDKDKFSFLITVLNQLYNTAYDEFMENYNILLNQFDCFSISTESGLNLDKETIKKFCKEIKKHSLEIVSKLMDENTDKDGRFNISKALDTFDFIFKYAKEYSYILNESKTFKVLGSNPYNFKKEVSLNEIMGAEKARYDNSVYRMHRLLIPDEIDEKYLN